MTAAVLSLAFEIRGPRPIAARPTGRYDVLMVLEADTYDGAGHDDDHDRDDGALVKDCLAGDADAYRILVDRYRDRAYWAAYNVVHHHEDAADIAQEAFIRAYHALARFDQGRKFYTWLYQIVVNLALDQLRRRGRAPAPLRMDDVAEPAGAGVEGMQALEARERREAIRAVLAELPEKYRVVLALRDMDGMSCKDIAGVVGCTHVTARWRLHQARRMFRQLWEARETRMAQGGQQP